MEPFGLFQLLQSFLSPAAAQKDPPPAQESANGQDAQSPPENVPPPEPDQTDYSKDAIIGFLNEHEKRAKRIR